MKLTMDVCMHTSLWSLWIFENYMQCIKQILMAKFFGSRFNYSSFVILRLHKYHWLVSGHSTVLRCFSAIVLTVPHHLCVLRPFKEAERGWYNILIVYNVVIIPTALCTAYYIPFQNDQVKNTCCQRCVPSLPCDFHDFFLRKAFWEQNGKYKK